MDMVLKAIMNPKMTPHHQPAIWKNRSPVRSSERGKPGQNMIRMNEGILPACQALRQQTIAAKIHGGLSDCKSGTAIKEWKTYAASNKEIVVENPSVSVKLQMRGIDRWVTLPPSADKNAYVGKKLTKLRPRSWESAITENMYTFGSFKASFKPSIGLSVTSSLSASPAS